MKIPFYYDHVVFMMLPLSHVKSSAVNQSGHERSVHNEGLEFKI